MQILNKQILLLPRRDIVHSSVVASMIFCEQTVKSNNISRFSTEREKRQKWNQLFSGFKISHVKVYDLDSSKEANYNHLVVGNDYCRDNVAAVPSDLSNKSIGGKIRGCWIRGD